MCIVCQANKNAAQDYDWPGVVFVRPLNFVGNYDVLYRLHGDPICQPVIGRAICSPQVWRPMFPPTAQRGGFVDVATGVAITSCSPENVSQKFPFADQHALKSRKQLENLARARQSDVSNALLPLDDDRPSRGIQLMRPDFEELQKIALVPPPEAAHVAAHVADEAARRQAAQLALDGAPRKRRKKAAPIMECRGDWEDVQNIEYQPIPVIALEASDLLPYQTAVGCLHLKTNHGCTACTSEQLCRKHQPPAKKPGQPGALTDLTRKHDAALWESGRIFVECGVDGDCFYHSVLFLAELFEPDLHAQWRTHKELRVKVCEYANTNYASMRWPLQQGSAAPGAGSMQYLDMLVARSSAPDRPPQDIVTSFTKSHKLSATPKRNGTFVECEMICAFAQFAQRPVVVTNHNHDGVHVWSPDGEPMQVTHPDAASTPFHIWCNGGHYQALVSLSKVQLHSKALASRAFLESHCVTKNLVRRPPYDAD